MDLAGADGANTREYLLNAEPALQLRLLELQDRDTHLAQIDHRLRTLPEAARLAELTARLIRVRDEITAAETIAGDLRLDQARADADVDQVRSAPGVTRSYWIRAASMTQSNCRACSMNLVRWPADKVNLKKSNLR